MKMLSAICFASIVAFAALSATAQPSPEASQEVRNAAVVEKLKAAPGTVAVYAQGLCCPSCAVGVRKKVVALKFVDQARLQEGIELDAKTQLVTVALKSGKKVDEKALSKAIKDAGYEPVHIYSLNKKGELVTKSL